MGSFSFWHWAIVLAVVLIIFGAGKLPAVMGDLAKGIKNFKSGMKDEDEQQASVQQAGQSEAARSGTTDRPAS